MEPTRRKRCALSCHHDGARFTTTLGLSVRNRIALFAFVLLIVGPGVFDIFRDLGNGRPVKTEWFGLLALLLVGIAFGMKKKSQPLEKVGLRWPGLAMFALLVGGLAYLAIVGDSTTQFMVGLFAMLLGFVVWFLFLGVGVGSAFHKSGSGREASGENQ